MTSLASTLEAQAPIIRSAQSIQQSASSMPNATQQEVQDTHQLVQQAIQAEQNALGIVAMMVSQMSESLNEASQEVGFCSTGDNKKNSLWEGPFAASSSTPEQRIAQALEDQGVDPADAAELAQLLLLIAEEKDVPPEDIAALLENSQGRIILRDQNGNIIGTGINIIKGK